MVGSPCMATFPKCKVLLAFLQVLHILKFTKKLFILKYLFRVLRNLENLEKSVNFVLFLKLSLFLLLHFQYICQIISLVSRELLRKIQNRQGILQIWSEKPERRKFFENPIVIYKCYYLLLFILVIIVLV